jgi:hypothetical protein
MNESNWVMSVSLLGILVILAIVVFFDSVHF